MTHVSAPLKSAFILPDLTSPTCSKSRMPTTWSALHTSPQHFARNPPSWFRSSTVSMWQFRIMEPRLLRFAFMKQCCNSPSQTDEGGTSLPPSSTKSSIKLLSASFAALPHETAHDVEHAASSRQGILQHDGRERQLHAKHGTLAQTALQLNLAPVLLNNPLGNGETQTCASHVPAACLIDSIETLEDFALFFRCDSDSSVSNRDQDSVILLFEREVHGSGRRSVLESVVQQDVDGASQCRFVSQDQRLPRLDGLAKLQIANIGNSPPTLSDFS